MCWLLPSCEMYEGKNIHYSLVDNKPLCSFSKKKCNQRRLNGYGFCVRHILEDPTAPFRRCGYVAKSSQHLCTQAIPQGEDRPYCNNHMQVLGMIPRRERKPKKDKDKDNSSKDNVTPVEASKLTFGDRLKSKKLNLPKAAAPSPLMGKILNPADDPDDPYAFHDAAPEVSPAANTLAQSGPVGMLPGGLADLASRSPYPPSLPSPSQVRPAVEGTGTGGMPKAKLYPELAEKLEKPRPAQEAKTSKSRARSSRTMNKLQTKIAQNKIKDKLRKSQESNQTDLSPSQVASPERVGLGSSAFLNSGIVGADFGAGAGGELNPANVNTTQLHPLALPGMMYPPLDSLRGQALGAGLLSGSSPDLYDIEQLKQSALSSHHHSFHPLPPPYPGLSVNREQRFSPPSGAVNSRTAGQSPVVETPVTTSLPSHTPPHTCLSFSQASSSSLPVVSPAQSQPHHLHLQHQTHTSHQSRLLPRHQSQAPTGTAHGVIPTDKLDLPFSPQLTSVLSQTVASRTANLNSANSAFPQTSAILTSKPPLPHTLHSPRSVDVRSSIDLPPPPPYVPRTRTCSVPTSVASSSSSVLLTHIQRPKGILTEKEAHCRLKSDEAVKLYGMYARQKIYNHVFMNSTMNLCASDEESSEDEMMEEPLPFQRDWKVISDDEEDNELEEGKDRQFRPHSIRRDGEVPPDLRMVKLGVMRARYRRHCTQTKHANRANTKNMNRSRKFTLALIHLAKSSPTIAAHTLSAIHKKSLQWPQERKNKRKQIWKKVCQYKDGADKRCTVMCLPYTNHCRKHIMYNVDQQLFQFCTAKNSDNTQCCMPVIDIRHDFPLCYPHALQAEKQKKEEATEVKKRPRKKTKPPALTRPPRKGKKKKGKNIRYQKPMPPDKPVGSISLPETLPMELPPSVPEPQPDVPPPAAAPACQPAASLSPVTPAPAPVAAPVAPLSQEGVKEVVVAPPPLSANRISMINDAKQQLEQALDLEETDFDKQLAELPLEQASRLLEDDAFENFPDDAFNDIFSMADKNGESDLAHETEKLERQLAEATDNVNKAQDTLDKLLSGSINMDDMGEQDTKQLAEMIATHYSGISVDCVQQSEIGGSTAPPGLDSYSGMTPDQAIGEIALSLQSQQPPLSRTTLTDYTPGSGTARGLVPQTISSMASFLPAGVATTINGISLPGAVGQNSAAYNQALAASLAAGYTHSPAIQQLTHGAGHVYSEGQHTQNYHVAPTASQSHGQLGGYSGVQTLPSAAVLLSGGAGGEVSTPQQLLARNLSRQQQSHLNAAAASVLSQQMDLGSSALHPQQGPMADALHPQAGPSTGPQQGLARTVSVHPQGLVSGVTSHVTPQHPSGVTSHVTPQHPSGVTSHVTPQHPSGVTSQLSVAPQHPSGVTSHVTHQHPSGVTSHVTPQHPSGVTSQLSRTPQHPSGVTSQLSVAPQHPSGVTSHVTPQHPSGVTSQHPSGVTSQLSRTPQHPSGVTSHVTPQHPSGVTSHVTPQHPSGVTSHVTPQHPSGVTSHVTPQHPSGVTSQLSRTPQHPSTSQLSSQLQAQPALAAQLASSPHSTWIHAAALQQQASQTSGYHTVNGFPATAQLPYTNATITTAHGLAAKSSTRQSKIKSHPGQITSVTSALHINPTTVAYPKQDIHSGANLANTVRVNATPSPPVTGLKQDPRLVALAQQHSRAVGRSGSPGLQGFVPGHSPSPTHSPQAVTQNLPPFSSALSAYQGNGAGS